MKNEKHWNWKGGRRIHAAGYVMVKTPAHLRASKGGYVFEHILVMEKALGKSILRLEMVHHIDGDRSNNNIGNLIVFKTIKMHTNYHIRLKAFQATGYWN